LTINKYVSVVMLLSFATFCHSV